MDNVVPYQTETEFRLKSNFAGVSLSSFSKTQLLTMLCHFIYCINPDTRLELCSNSVKVHLNTTSSIESCSVTPLRISGKQLKKQKVRFISRGIYSRLENENLTSLFWLTSTFADTFEWAWWGVVLSYKLEGSIKKFKTEAGC